MIFKNKKGDLRENITDLIIGVLCVILIIAAAVIIYRVFANQENQNAKNTLSNLEGKVNALDAGQGNSFIIQGFKGVASENNADQTWYFVGWSKNESSRPDQCYFESCICICKGYLVATKYQTKQELATECANQGFCKTFNVDNIAVTRTVYVSEQTTGVYYPQAGAAGAITYDDSTKKTCVGIPLKTNLLQINVTKLKNEIDITYQSDGTADKGRNCLEIT